MDVYGPWQVINRKRRPGFKKEERIVNCVMNKFDSLKEDEALDMETDQAKSSEENCPLKILEEWKEVKEKNVGRSEKAIMNPFEGKEGKKRLLGKTREKVNSVSMLLKRNQSMSRSAWIRRQKSCIRS
ncbi:hypothetical protein Cni_G15550 [Canna indica]|uniref:Uncharacterized protein n=1 Tax=Canna indica TaxID=4628 RepID=A0AAQ3QBP8_9LILI|nr:hypothetical protein Cni_G15550 [Canna indica]